MRQKKLVLIAGTSKAMGMAGAAEGLGGADGLLKTVADVIAKPVRWRCGTDAAD